MSSRIESGFVPLPKVEQEQPEERIRIHLNLPSYIDQDKIGVNLTGISKLCRLGGIRELVVIGNTGEETSHVIPEIVDLNSDGSAVASKKIAKVAVPTFEMDIKDNKGQTENISTRAVNLNIKINIDELASRVTEKPEGAHSVKNWTKELDKGFKVPIRKSGNQNLLRNLEWNDRTAYIAAGGFSVGVPFIDLFATLRGDIIFLEAQLASVALIVGALKASETLSLRKHPDFRYSLFLGYQIDRAIALGISSRTKPLIKDLQHDRK